MSSSGSESESSSSSSPPYSPSGVMKTLRAKRCRDVKNAREKSRCLTGVRKYYCARHGGKFTKGYTVAALSDGDSDSGSGHRRYRVSGRCVGAEESTGDKKPTAWDRVLKATFKLTKKDGKSYRDTMEIAGPVYRSYRRKHAGRDGRLKLSSEALRALVSEIHKKSKTWKKPK